jgi:hypothetical protein
MSRFELANLSNVTARRAEKVQSVLSHRLPPSSQANDRASHFIPARIFASAE